MPNSELYSLIHRANYFFHLKLMYEKCKERPNLPHPLQYPLETLINNQQKRIINGYGREVFIGMSNDRVEVEIDINN